MNTNRLKTRASKVVALVTKTTGKTKISFKNLKDRISISTSPTTWAISFEKFTLFNDGTFWTNPEFEFEDLEQARLDLADLGLCDHCGEFAQLETTEETIVCDSCNGSGEGRNERESCSQCRGEGGFGLKEESLCRECQ